MVHKIDKKSQPRPTIRAIGYANNKAKPKQTDQNSTELHYSNVDIPMYAKHICTQARIYVKSMYGKDICKSVRKCNKSVDTVNNAC